VKSGPFTQILKELPKFIPEPDQFLIGLRWRKGAHILIERPMLANNALEPLGVFNGGLNFQTVPNHPGVVEDALKFAGAVVCNNIIAREMEINDRPLITDRLGSETRIEGNVDKLPVVLIVRKASPFEMLEGF
jgi:hypothetical protein